MKAHFMSVVAVVAALFFFKPFAPDSAHACKYPCVSQAPTTLNQVTPAPNPAVAPASTPPTSQQMQQCSNYAKTVMTGSTLYNQMASLPQQEQYAFFFATMGSGGGMNDLSAQTQSLMFNGNMTAYNSWINDNTYGTNGYVNNITFNPATGELVQGGSVIDTLGGWSCPYYP